MSTAVVNRKRKTPSNRGPLVITGIVILFALVTLGVLHATGRYRLPFLASTSQASDHEGKTFVPLCVKERLPRFTAIRAEDLSGNWFNEAEVKQAGFLLKQSQIVGRVLKHDKVKPQAFKESDFFPPNTKPSPTLGVAKDKVGAYVDPAKVPGLSGMGPDDRFQIWATQGSKGQSPIPASPEVARQQGWSAPQEIVVKNGRVVVTGSKSATASGEERHYYIELEPMELSALTQAQARSATLLCVSISAQAAKDEVPELRSGEQPGQIEILSGGKSRTMQTEVQKPEEQPKRSKEDQGR